MPKVHFVKSARKDNKVVKKEESYYWWAHRVTVGNKIASIKKMSKTRPSRSQLTMSEFLGQLYDLEDRVGNIGGYENAEDLLSDLEDIVNDINTLADAQEDKLYNMPEQFQEGDTGQLLQERADAMRDWASELESIECSYDEDEGPFDEWLEDKLTEIQGTMHSL